MPRIPSAVVPLADKARPILYVELNWLVTRAERPHLVADGRHQNVSAIEVLLRQLDRLPLCQKSVGPAISCRGESEMNARNLDVARQRLRGQCAALRRRRIVGQNVKAAFRRMTVCRRCRQIVWQCNRLRERSRQPSRSSPQLEGKCPRLVCPERGNKRVVHRSTADRLLLAVHLAS